MGEPSFHDWGHESGSDSWPNSNRYGASTCNMPRPLEDDLDSYQLSETLSNEKVKRIESKSFRTIPWTRVKKTWSKSWVKSNTPITIERSRRESTPRMLKESLINTVMQKYTPTLQKVTATGGKHKKSKSTVYNHLKEQWLERKAERKERRHMTKAICQLSKALK